MEERYTELFQNVYGAKNEHPLNKIEEKREEIKDIVKEALGMLNHINVNIKMYIFDHLRMYIFAILPLDRYIFLSDKIFL